MLRPAYVLYVRTVLNVRSTVSTTVRIRTKAVLTNRLRSSLTYYYSVGKRSKAVLLLGA